MYYKYHRIDEDTFAYCCKNAIIDAHLSKKWKEPGYERLCSMHAIDSRNFQFGGTSICRVPRSKLRPDQVNIKAAFNGCIGCASGKEGMHNIFGNKYGQRLAAIQIEREKRDEQERAKFESELAERKREKELEKEEKKKKKNVKKKTEEDNPWAKSKEEEVIATRYDGEEADGVTVATLTTAGESNDPAKRLKQDVE